LKTDQTRAELRREIRSYGKTLANNRGVGLFYYSGRAVQFDDVNYLVPLNSDIQQGFEIPDEAVALDYLFQQLANTQNKSNLVEVFNN